MLYNTKSRFDSLLPIIDEYVTKKCQIQSLFFTNSEAKLSSNSGMTHKPLKMQLELESQFSRA